MSSTPSDRKGSSAWPAVDRRKGAKRRSGLGRLQALLGRPLRLERREGHLHVVLVDRRQPSQSDPAVALELMRTELRDRLLAHQNAQAARAMRHLIFVHHALGRGGWAGVGALPLRVLRRSLTQAEMLANDEESPLLAQVVDQLRACYVAAELREERATGAAQGRAGDETMVSEVSHEEFAEMQRGWIDTVSSVLTLTPLAMAR